MLTRRQFIVGSLAVVASGAGLAAYATEVEPFWIDVVRLPLPVAELPPLLEGATLVQLADLHVGGDVPDDYILRAFAIVADIAPEILVVTGDLIAGGMNDRVENVFSRMPRGQLATVCTLGNHDYGVGWSDADTAQAVAEMMERRGAVVLRNESMTVVGMRVIGFDELWADRFRPGDALSGVDVNGATIALSHNPDTVDLDGWGAYRGWVLSGHTHGGQVRVPGLTPPRLPVENKRYVSGAYDLEDGRMLYVNRGVGFLEQVRLFVRPEITVFELHAAT
jgi:predicted MPP superfamily phosphohydrolase